MSKTFENAKVGDKVWDIIYGWGNIISVIKDYPFPIMVEFGNGKRTSYKFNGKYNDTDVNPVLFWNEIKIDIPEKPFDLESELKKLKVQEFKTAERNYFLTWDNADKSIYYDIVGNNEQPDIKYFTEQSINNFMEKIEDKKYLKNNFLKHIKKFLVSIMVNDNDFNAK